MATKERMDALRQRKAKLEEQLAALEAREKAKERKDDTRLKVLIGAAMLAHAKINPSAVATLKKLLHKAITAPRDREFLRGKGWLEEDANGQQTGEEKAGQ